MFSPLLLLGLFRLKEKFWLMKPEFFF